MLFIDTPRNTLHLAEAARFAGGNDAAFRLRLRQEAARFYLELRELEPNADQYAEAASFMSDISGLALLREQAQALGFPCHDEGPAVSYTAGPFVNDHEALLASLGGASL